MLITSYNNIITIPGIQKNKSSAWLIQDVIFFIVAIALPTSFFAFLPKSLFYDVRLLFWLMGMIYGLFYFKYIKKIARLPGGKLLIFVVFFIIFRFAYSIFINNIPLREVVTIFRTNFHYPITALGFLLYAASMDNKRINRFLHWLYYIILFLGILYIISSLTLINFYAVVSKEDSVEFLTMGENLAALPRYLNILFAVGLLTVFTFKKAKYHLLWTIPFIVTAVSIVRSRIIVFLLILFLFLIFGYLYFKEIKFGRIVKVWVFLLFVAVISSFIFSSNVDALITKFGRNYSGQVSNYTEVGTYAFRLRLIQEAYTRTKANGNLFLGNGYIREASKGEYDFVLGGDTLIPSVLYTEGFLGLFIRLLPVLFFLWFGIKNIKKQNSPYQYISLIMVIIIIPAIINGVQTTIFTRYTEVLFIFYLFMLYIYNQQKASKQNLNINMQQSGHNLS